MVGIIIGTLIALFVLILVVSFNNLAKSRNRVDAAWQQVKAGFDKRRALISPILEMLASVSEEDARRFKETFRSRRHGAGDDGITVVQNTESDLSHEFKNVLRRMGAYPDITGNPKFVEYCRKLQDIEEQIETSRKTYNDNVRTYNSMRTRFPVGLLSSLFDYTPESYFEVEYATDSRKSKQ